jgi:hypothetical protein
VPLEDPVGWSTAAVSAVVNADPGHAWVALSAGNRVDNFGRLARLQLDEGSGAGTVGFQVAAIRIGEQGPPRTARVVRSGGSNGAVSVRYEVTSASAGLMPLTGMLNWADGDASPRSIEIQVQDDVQLEGEQTATVRLFDAAGGIGLVNEVLTVIVEDDEALAQLRINARSTQIVAGQKAQFVLSLNHPAPGPVTVIAVGGDALDESGFPAYARRNSAGPHFEEIAWKAGETVGHTVEISTNEVSDTNFTIDLHLGLLTQTGIVLRTAGGQAVTATVRVVGGKVPSQGSTPASGAGASAGVGGQGGGGAIALWTISLLVGLLAGRCRAALQEG